MSIAVDTPHLAFPFTLSADGTQVQVVEQDSVDEVMACVNLIADMDISVRWDRSDFGWEMPDMDMEPVSVQGLADAINLLEPRATATVSPDTTDVTDLGNAIENLSLNIEIPDAATTQSQSS